MFNVEINDMPKLQSPFIRSGEDWTVTQVVDADQEWVFEDEGVLAVEKLNGTNVSVVVQQGIVVAVFNRTERIPFINRGKAHIIAGVQAAYERGWIDVLGDGQHFGELIGEKVQGNPHKIEGHLWVPFSWAKKKLAYNTWGKYPKTYDAISAWFAEGPLSLWALSKGRDELAEGIVFHHPDGRMAKLRRDMFPSYKGKRHKQE